MKRTMAIVIALALSVSATAAQGTRMHPAYLDGYPDGTIRPYDTISRQELCQILLRLLPEDAPSGSCGYLDVLPQQWSYLAVSTMVTLEIYPPIPSAYFEPKKKVTAEEFCEVIKRAGKHVGVRSDTAICLDGETVTRAQAAHIINELFSRCEHPGMEGMLTWRDLSEEDACYADLIEAANTHTAKDGRWTGLG